MPKIEWKRVGYNKEWYMEYSVMQQKKYRGCSKIRTDIIEMCAKSTEIQTKGP